MVLPKRVSRQLQRERSGKDFAVNEVGVNRRIVSEYFHKQQPTVFAFHPKTLQ